MVRHGKGDHGELKGQALYNEDAEVSLVAHGLVQSLNLDKIVASYTNELGESKVKEKKCQI